MNGSSVPNTLGWCAYYLLWPFPRSWRDRAALAVYRPCVSVVLWRLRRRKDV